VTARSEEIDREDEEDEGGGEPDNRRGIEELHHEDRDDQGSVDAFGTKGGESGDYEESHRDGESHLQLFAAEGRGPRVTDVNRKASRAISRPPAYAP
jgi:hypothetical protein